MDVTLHGILDPGELDLITAVIDDVCLAEEIGDAAGREEVALKAMELYNSGIRQPGTLRQSLLRWRDGSA